LITDINILLLQEMKPPQGSRSALVLSSAAKLTSFRLGERSFI